ncbi:Sucraseferredoxin-like protein [Dactylonectria macrodidyma]|uniref:Sucraseferredoxin-like protein n=1 Tax=Dactylonectria macrodidyma TaxID=307937 RepID=A0A9P9FB91_9HYPO|nr:Sucraseferredoxin-like protein [Dactylonectria macrodidyma]
MLSAANIPTPDGTSDYSKPTCALLLPAFVVVNNLVPKNVPQLINLVETAPTTASPLQCFNPPTALPSSGPIIPDITIKACPHNAIILLCSQKSRDARCGQSAPLLRKEFERQLRPLGLYRDLNDERPGGVGIYFISHVGGHKYSANVMIYRRPNAFGQDDVLTNEESERQTKDMGDFGASQCIWLARVRPEDCENLIRYTVIKGKVVKPERQLRGGFDRAKGIMSW